MKRISAAKLLLLSLIICIFASCGGGGNDSGTQSPNPPPTSNPPPNPIPPPTPTPDKGGILVFSKTAGYRHEAISAGQTMLSSIALDNGWVIDFTEDSSQFNGTNLSQYSVVVWLNTTGDVLNIDEQTAFENYIETGGGYVGIHAASDTEYSWSWYGDLVGAYFDSHPQIQQATLNIEDNTHSSTQALEATWVHTDEWYNFQTNPRENVTVLMSINESTYNPGAAAMGDHPIAWYRNVGEGRSFYTGLGHTAESYQNQNFIGHIEGALIWAGALLPGAPAWTGAAPSEGDFSSTVLASSINQPMELDISRAGDLYIIGREGQFYAMENGALVEKSTILVNASFEGGLIGFALDPNFTNNRYAYFHYTDPVLAQHNISRITIDGNNSLNLASESILLSFPVQIDECCHVGGSMDFDGQGNLYIAVGDNTNPFDSGGYSPIDERNGRSAWDAQKSAANTNDLRGKILRIMPSVDGYTNPVGNLFEQSSLNRGEIFTMGHRNPFRISIDSQTDQLFWADIGPDAGGSNPNRGPGGYDELNKTKLAGNFGWPYFAGNNEAYNDYNFSTNTSGAKFDPLNVVNDSPNNNGATALPNAQPAWVTLSHRALMVAGVYRWDPAVTDEYKLPSYFDGRLLYWNFNNDEMFEAPVDEAAPQLRRWLDTSVMDGIIDGVISPYDNRLYLISFGGNCCGKPNDAGLLVEVKYTGVGNNNIARSGYAINTGGTSFTAADNTLYQADNFFSGGNSSDSALAIASTEDDSLFQSHRWQSGGFSYHLPIKNGDYNVTLQFAETSFNNAGLRVFHVDAEDVRIVSDLDVFAEVGATTAYQATAIVTVVDGVLDLDFVSKVENPMVSGIKVSAVQAFPSGTNITFIAAVNGQYVTTNNGALIASADTAGDGETFLIVDAGNGFIALKSLMSGGYVTVLADGSLEATATSVSEKEWFSLIENANETFALRAAINGFYVAAENSGSGNLVADRETIALWEEFTLAQAEVCIPNLNNAITCRPNAKAYLDMPKTAAADLSNIPLLLSQTGAFSDVANMTTIDSLIPYEPIAKLWSDRAEKLRWVSIPSGEKVVWAEQGKWQWPAGTVFVKHFALPVDESNPTILRRLETRLIVVRDDELVYGVTYKWREDNSEADLLTTALAEDISVSSPSGDWQQTWHYPGPTDCLSCHNSEAKGVLGLKTAALNSDFDYPSGVPSNQLVTLNQLGIFSTELNELQIANYPAHANISDQTKTLEHRVRSYWDINCASCHGPQGIAALWDARYETALADQGVIHGALANQRDYFADYGLSDAKVVDPGNINNSILYIRDKSIDADDRMPPLGRVLEDTEYLDVLEQWINSLE